MKHTGFTYKILRNLEELQGKTIIEVYTQDINDTFGLDGMTYIITNSTIALHDGGICHRFDTLSSREVADFENHTGINSKQILEQ